MTELQKGDRFWSLCDTGEDAKRLLVEHVEAVLAVEASVVIGVDGIGFVDQGLEHGDRRIVGEPDQRAAAASGRFLNPDLAVGHDDHSAALGAIDVDGDVIEIGSGHATAIRPLGESGQAA
jgi:hypothetical protein